MPLIKRSSHNNTHSNIVDDSIKEISAWRRDSSKLFRLIILYFLSFGIFFIIVRIWKKLYISLACKPCSAKDAEYFVITDDEKSTDIVYAVYENFFFINSNLKDMSSSRANKMELSQSPYVGAEIKNPSEQTLVIYFRYNKYLYLESENCFTPLIFDLTKYSNYEVHKVFGIKGKFKNNKTLSKEESLSGIGIKNIKDYNYLLNKYGENLIAMRHKSFIIIFLEQLFSPFYIYQIYAIFVWTFICYTSFAYIVLLCTIIILLVNSRLNHLNYKKILNFNHSVPAYVQREFQVKSEISRKEVFMPRRTTLIKERSILETASALHDSRFIVPGDILELNNEDIIPCDCLILDGFCTVNESDLTGESTLVLKHPLNRDTREFDYENNYKSFLYHGTLIKRCESDSDSPDRSGIIVMALNTGYNTNRGNLIQNLLFPKPTNFKFYKDIQIYFVWMCVIYILVIIGMILISKGKTIATDISSLEFCNFQIRNQIFWKIFDNITVVFPPTLPICLTFASFYFHWNLSKKKISCIDDRRMIASGKTSTILLDKTGTLTEEGLEIYGFQTVRFVNRVEEFADNKNEIKKSFSSQDERYLDFEQIEPDMKMMNQVLKRFWKQFCKDHETYIDQYYQTNSQHSMIFFTECLATCHSIDKLRQETLGNTIDKKIFEKLDWVMEKYDPVDQDEFGDDREIQYIFKPKNAYKITENFIFGQRRAPFFKLFNNEGKKDNKYQLIVIKRFEFSSKFQSMSVIVKNFLDESYRFYIKGAPEKIVQACMDETVPKNFEEIHISYTKEGFRVLACATKVLPSRNDYHTEKDRRKFENELCFLGMIIFKNKLKRDTKHVISNLKNSNCNLVMATGDNPFTSISVARECDLIEINKKHIFLIDIEKEKDEEVERLKIFALTKEEFEDGGEDDNFNKPLQNIRRSTHSKVEKKSKEVHRSLNLGNNISSISRGMDNTDRKFINKSSNYAIENSQSNKDKKNDYKNELVLKVKEIIKKDAILCVSGKAFGFMLAMFKNETNFYNSFPDMKIEDGLPNTLLREKMFKNLPKDDYSKYHKHIYAGLLFLVYEKGRIFYRMSPKDKVDLVNFYKEDQVSIIAMCGDGANDCGALLSSDVGITVNQENNGNSVTSHFYSTDESISCIEHILKNGRACFENSVVIFKYMILNGIIQINSVMILYYLDLEFQHQQYLFIDCFISLISVVIASKTGPNYKLKNESPPKSLINKQFFASVIGQSIFQIASQTSFFLFFIQYRTNVYEKSIRTSVSISIILVHFYFFSFSIYISSCSFQFDFKTQKRLLCK